MCLSLTCYSRYFSLSASCRRLIHAT
ncbi:hypothetical protein E2C01_033227 [Portunus trituberculatus]|uniref:Uncharacterized protein n=1 Tax=Portunus trituberculatus TaxID=210409 RepID=A0A5B7EZL0_PORTR|nr:hypothetical protein [Portunus trituberculatus]